MPRSAWSPGATTRLTVRNSRFEALRSDGIDSVGNSNVLIENNRFSDTRGIPRIGNKGDADFVDGDHSDAIQIWAPVDVPVSTDITIRNNVIEGPTQGINTFGPHGDGYQRITIENNTLDTRYAAGISVMQLHRLPGALQPPDTQCRGAEQDQHAHRQFDRPVLRQRDHGHSLARANAECPDGVNLAAKAGCTATKACASCALLPDGELSPGHMAVRPWRNW